MLHAIVIAQGDTPNVLGWSLALIALLVLGWVLVSWLKRRLRDAGEFGPVGFSLSDLRQLHKQGAMTDEEFERAKAKIVEAAKRSALQSANRATTNRSNPGISRHD